MFDSKWGKLSCCFFANDYSIIPTISRKRGLIQSGIHVAESIWNRISTPVKSNPTIMIKEGESIRIFSYFYSHVDHLDLEHVDEIYRVYLNEQLAYILTIKLEHTYWNEAIEFFLSRRFVCRLKMIDEWKLFI